MEGYALSSKDGRLFTLVEVAAFDHATEMIAGLDEGEIPVRRLGASGLLRCHELARGVAEVLKRRGLVGWTVVDGLYGLVDHSWLVSERGNILDVYAIAALPMVQLVNTGCAGVRRPRQGYPGYREGEPRTDILEDVVQWLVEEL